MYVVEMMHKRQWIELREFKDQDQAIAIARGWATKEKPYRVRDNLGMVIFQSNKVNLVKHVQS